jgi:predicted nucleic-acid-binding Zn-ribbon protein
MNNAMTEPVEIEDHLQECPKCSSEHFRDDRAELMTPWDLVHQLVCSNCGFTWKELYEFKYSCYELED